MMDLPSTSPARRARVAVITGAGAGQGRAAALSFARSGYDLGLCDIDGDALADTATSVRSVVPASRIVESKCDLAAISEVEGFTASIRAEFDSVDVLYNNAGIISRGAVEDTSLDEWERIFAVNVRAPFLLVKSLLPLLRSCNGTVINVSSGAAFSAIRAGMVTYAASKGAVVSFTRALAQELADDGIRVNCIVPGVIESSMSERFYASIPESMREPARAAAASRTMRKRIGTPEEVASVALFLASDAAAYINGAVIPVDDGFTAS